jgi:hypothetical protein
MTAWKSTKMQVLIIYSHPRISFGSSRISYYFTSMLGIIEIRSKSAYIVGSGQGKGNQ